MFHVGDVVRKLREQRGARLVDFAKEAGISPTTLTTLETTGANFKPETLAKVLAALGVSEMDAYKAIGQYPDGFREALLEELQKSHPLADTSVTPNPLEEDGSVMNRGLPVPDVDLFGEILGVWRLLRSRAARETFVEHAREHLGLPREALRRKNARR